MSAVLPLCNLVGIDTSKISKNEFLILEAFLLSRIYQELIEAFKPECRDFSNLSKRYAETENIMLESNLTRLIITDILNSEEYTIQGIATYTDTHNDVILDIASGKCIPSALLYKRIIELHRIVRRDLYDSILAKISNSLPTQITSLG